jgi:hypothetical protein
MDLVHKCLEYMLKMYDGVDGFGLVSFNSIVEVVQPLTALEDEKIRESCVKSVQGLRAGGSTDLCGGVLKGLDLLAGSNNSKNIVLITDGYANIGTSDATGILKVIKSHEVGSDVCIFVVSVGSDVDQDLLQTLAVRCKGKLSIVLNDKEIPLAFGDFMGGLLSTAFNDVKVKFLVEGKSAISVEDQSSLEHEVTDEGRGISYNLGPISSGEQRDLLVKVVVPLVRQGVTNVGSFTLCCEDPWNKEKFNAGAPLLVNATATEGEIDTQTHLHVLRVKVSDTIDKISGSVRGIQEVDLLYSYLEGIKKTLKSYTPSPLRDQLIEDISTVCTYKGHRVHATAFLYRQISAALKTQRAVSNGACLHNVPRSASEGFVLQPGSLIPMPTLLCRHDQTLGQVHEHPAPIVRSCSMYSTSLQRQTSMTFQNQS